MDKKKNCISLIFVVILCVSTSQSQRRPPNYSQDSMPITSFTCRDKLIGGYYADPETDCQMFHVCVKVAGVGVQDFRFLCPNDTTFDQEHQICDDWYNIECEPSTLYLNTNFDLYRLGADNEVVKRVSTSKATPIPLGPSTTLKPWLIQSPQKPSLHSLNSAVSDEEDEFFLQRAEVADKKSSHDILRESSSGNFFSSKNKGRDDLEEKYQQPNSASKQQDLNKNNVEEEKKKKTLVRKLVTNKRPVQSPNNVQTQQVKTPDQQYNNFPNTQKQYNNPPAAQKQFNNPPVLPQQYSTTAVQLQYNPQPTPQQYNPAPAQQYNSAPAQQYSNIQVKPYNSPSTVLPSQFPSANPTPQQYTNVAYNSKQNNNFFNSPSTTANYPQYSTVSVYSTTKVNRNRGKVNYNSYLKSEQEEYKETTTQYPTFYQKINNLTDPAFDDESRYFKVSPVNNNNYQPNKNYDHKLSSNEIANINNNYDNFEPAKENAYRKPVKTQSTSLPSSVPNNFNQYTLSGQLPAYINNKLQEPSTQKIAKVATTEATTKKVDTQYYNAPSATPTKVYVQPPPRTNTTAAQPTVNYYQYTTQANYQQPSTPYQIYDDRYYQYFNSLLQNVQPAIPYVPYEEPVASSTSTINPYYQSTSAIPDYYQTFDYSKYYQTSTENLYYQSNTAKPTTARYDPYSVFQKSTTTATYDFDDEFLKTAQSSNLKPSDLNTIYKKQSELLVNATLKAAYNLEQPQKSISKTIYSPSVTPVISYSTTAPTTPKTATIVKNTSSPASYYPANATNKSVGPASSSKPSDYDYAYYDDNTSSEYDVFKPIAEEFAKLNVAQQNQKTTK